MVRVTSPPLMVEVLWEQQCCLELNKSWRKKLYGVARQAKKNKKK